MCLTTPFIVIVVPQFGCRTSRRLRISLLTLSLVLIKFDTELYCLKEQARFSVGRALVRREKLEQSQSIHWLVA